MSEMLRVTNWERFQFKRNKYEQHNGGPWIKLYKCLLTSSTRHRMTETQLLHYILILLKAGDSDGYIENDPRLIQRMLSLDSLPELDVMVDLGVLQECDKSAGNGSETTGQTTVDSVTGTRRRPVRARTVYDLYAHSYSHTCTALREEQTRIDKSREDTPPYNPPPPLDGSPDICNDFDQGQPDDTPPRSIQNRSYVTPDPLPVITPPEPPPPHPQSLERTAVSKQGAHALVKTFFEEVFWPAYPRKQAKADARKVMLKLKPAAELQAEIIAGLERAKLCRQWQRDGGDYIPLAATWLRAERWTDEYEIDMPTERRMTREEQDQQAIQEALALTSGRVYEH